MSFIHLHVHSQYSFLDGASSLDRLLGKVKALNMPALALTDHDRLTGAIRFYEKAKAMGIKPIVGAEVTLDGGYHLTLLCKDKKGYSNLCRLLTEAHLTNRGKQPAATKSILVKFSDGLIALSGCSRGELQTTFFFVPVHFLHQIDSWLRLLYDYSGLCLLCLIYTISIY